MIKIGDRVLGTDQPVYLIAELSANHRQDIGIAIKTIQEMAKAGADAIKLQTYTADTLTLPYKTKPFLIDGGTAWDGSYLHDLYKEAEMPWEWHSALIQECKALGMDCFSTPFDRTAADLLKDLEVPAYKIASFEITDIPLIEYVASFGKPIIISTGIAGVKDIEWAVEACLRQGNNQIVLLKCTSAYPAADSSMMLLQMQDLHRRFGLPVGLSDHSEGVLAPVVATTLGAVMIEKHVILDRSMGGPDAHFSLEPAEFATLVSEVRRAESMLGKGNTTFPEQGKKSPFARSLFITKDVKKGEPIGFENVRSIRPSDGLHPRYFPELIGRTFAVDLPGGTPLQFEHLKPLP
jgi:pseudaminic acid synthase